MGLHALSEPGLNFRIPLNTVTSDGAYQSTLIVQDLVTRFNQRDEPSQSRMADFKVPGDLEVN